MQAGAWFILSFFSDHTDSSLFKKLCDSDIWVQREVRCMVSYRILPLDRSGMQRSAE